MKYPASISVREVKRVVVGRSREVNNKITRTILIVADEGEEIEIDLWSTDDSDELNLEIQ